MSRVVIVGRTRMRGGHICIGGHDLDNKFRAVRLLDLFGDNWPSDVPFEVGDVWDIRYTKKESARPPHVEDVFVSEYHSLTRIVNVGDLVLKHGRPWTGPPQQLFDETVRGTSSGSPYIPAKGRLPRCSTGYWTPDERLLRKVSRDHVRFEWTGEGEIRRFTWVGVQEPPIHIAAGSLVRVSLSRLFDPKTAPEGYYVQVSGVLHPRTDATSGDDVGK